MDSDSNFSSHSSKTWGIPSWLTQFQSKIAEVIAQSPAADLEKNIKAVMTQGFSKLELVTREEFDLQINILAKTRAKLEALELRLKNIEDVRGDMPNTPAQVQQG